MSGVPDLDAAFNWLRRLRNADALTSQTAWSVPQVIEHLAQSVEYSIEGYPEAKPEWFRSTVGRLAGAAFQRAGSMRHDLEAPIPGAPALAATDLQLACDRLAAALTGFANFSGPLQPHFAYGHLTHQEYLRAHLMHIANHAAKIEIQA